MACIVDANIVIAYQQIERLNVLRLYSRHVDKLLLPALILYDELPFLSPRERGCFHLLEPTIDQVSQAVGAGRRPGPLSEPDHLCLILAKAHSFDLMTNDTPLVKAAEAEGITVFRNPGLLLPLVRHGIMTRADALGIAGLLRKKDPRRIHDGIIADFKALLDC